MEKEVEDIILSLSPIERKILPFLAEKSIDKISKKSGLDTTTVKRALQFLSNKNILKISIEKKKKVLLDDNGKIYLKEGLPEKRLLSLLEKNKSISLEEVGKTGLSDEEFKVALGTLKSKTLIDIKQGKILLVGKIKEEKSIEEKFLNELPLDVEYITAEQNYALEQLKGRKKIIKIEDINDISFKISELGKRILANANKIKTNLIEELTPEMIRKGAWINKQFRKYDIQSKAPSVYGGRVHPFTKIIELVRQTFLDMGFKEMTGPWVETAFWCMDSMWIPQDHPSRELQDTFYLPYSGDIPKELSKKIAAVHEYGGKTGSKGYGYKWDPKIAAQLLLRTHTTAVTYRKFGEGIKPPAKYFCIGRIFRNETINPTHLPEFHHVEGFVMDENLTLRDLMGYIKEFYKRMGIKKIKFRPAYNPYTEPSMEAVGYSEERKEWIELINSGVFRPEALEPYGIKTPVIAWGLGLERLAMLMYGKKTLKELIGATCNLEWLRKYNIPKIKW